MQTYEDRSEKQRGMVYICDILAVEMTCKQMHDEGTITADRSQQEWRQNIAVACCAINDSGVPLI